MNHSDETNTNESAIFPPVQIDYAQFLRFDHWAESDAIVNRAAWIDAVARIQKMAKDSGKIIMVRAQVRK